MEEKTPLMQQYADIKKQHQDTLLFFQVGDFYELFYDDAITTSRALGITLTSRGKSKNGMSIPLCGVPVHTIEFYLKKLLDQGFKIALCDQLGEAQPGIVIQRAVVCVFTPGTLIDASLLREKNPSYLLSITEINGTLGFVTVELLTATIQCTSFLQTNTRLLKAELARFSPDEIIIPNVLLEKIAFLKEQKFFVSPYTHDTTDMPEWLQQRKIVCPDHCLQEPATYQALEQLYSYLKYTNPKSLCQSYTISHYIPEEYLVIDATTQSNLGLFALSQEKKHSLFDVLDNCVTPMGSRLLKKWLLSPLKQQHAIERRLRIVQYFFQNYSTLLGIRKLFGHIGDFERVVGRIALDRSGVSDYRSVAHVLSHITLFLDYITALCQRELIIPITRLEQCQNLQKLRELLDISLHDDHTTGYIIKEGYNQELDELRQFAHNMRKKIIELEQHEQQKTGIATLKIRHSQLHGYYIEVTQSHVHKIPHTYKRLQSLSGRERYINQELQELAERVGYATKNLSMIEQAIFTRIQQETAMYLPLLRQLSFLFSYFDVITNYAHTAHEHSYVMPQLNEEGIISITAGRHPVIERIATHAFVPNNVNLDNEQFCIVLTGPNMGGKSTYLRQIALICLMAHTGSFVPATCANIMILDRIFTRIGAGDNLPEGKSTFLVEMEEVATICQYATPKSLVILDEVGRGTSTSDGIAIAQAILEYLCVASRPRCLFATHYHELAQLENVYRQITSYCVESRENSQGILFLYTVIRGIASGSFGIEVTKMAQLPPEIIQRATQLLKQEHRADNVATKEIQEATEKIKLLENTIIALENRYKPLRAINPDTLTPKQALDLLFQLSHSREVTTEKIISQ